MAIILRSNNRLVNIHMSVRVVAILQVRRSNIIISSTNSIPTVATTMLQRRCHSNSNDSTTIPCRYLRSALEGIGEDEVRVAVGLRGGQRWYPLDAPASFCSFGWAVVGAGMLMGRLIMIFSRVLGRFKP